MDRVPIQSRGGSNTAYKIGPMTACLYDDWRPREAGISEAENEANARLIAAAPSLLAALKEVLAHVEDMDAPRVGNQCTLCHTYREIVRAAIAHAESKS